MDLGRFSLTSLVPQQQLQQQQQQQPGAAFSPSPPLAPASQLPPDEAALYRCFSLKVNNISAYLCDGHFTWPDAQGPAAQGQRGGRAGAGGAGRGAGGAGGSLEEEEVPDQFDSAGSSVDGSSSGSDGAAATRRRRSGSSSCTPPALPASGGTAGEGRGAGGGPGGLLGGPGEASWDLRRVLRRQLKGAGAGAGGRGLPLLTLLDRFQVGLLMALMALPY